MTDPAPTSPTIRNHESSRSGRWFLVVLGLAIALVGALFVGLMLRSFLRAKAMRDWPEVPCVILVSEIEQRIHDSQSPTEYRQIVSFGYEWKGTPHTGNRLTLRGGSWSSKRELATKRVTEYPVGSTSTCRIDPENPDFAVLRMDSLAPGYSIWFPGLFVVGGLGIAVRAVIPSRRNQRISADR